MSEVTCFNCKNKQLAEELICLCPDCHHPVNADTEIKEQTIDFEEYELPEKVDCPECSGDATQIGDDQLYKCTDCGRETVRLQ